MKIQISKSFFILIVIFAILGELPKITLFWLAVFLHELSHIFIAKILGVKATTLSINALGMNCILEDIDMQTLSKKIIITSAGVLSNLILFLLLNILNNDNIFLKDFMYYNIILAIFNLLPIYPLDGGKIFLYTFGFINGHLICAKKLIKIGKWLSFLISFFGLILTILSPSNIIIYIMGVYLFRKQSNELYAKIYFDFYKFLNSKYDNHRIYKVKELILHSDTTLNEVINLLSFDHQVICYFYDQNIYVDVFERDLFAYTRTKSITTKLSELEILII